MKLINSFIGKGFIEPKICDSLIQLYESFSVKSPGAVGEGNDSIVNRSLKDNTEVFIPITESSLFQYITALTTVLDTYKQKYVYATKQQASWLIEKNIKIQKYLPGQGYHLWHFEKTGDQSCVNRHLAFATFLNNIKDSGARGGTEFYYQKLKIKPQKGLTIIFPAEWTHTHRGIVTNKDIKYLITGWFSYNMEKLDG